MARIFISYSRSDRLFLDTFLPLIRKVYGNDSLWYDDDIHGGADWWGIILSEIGDCELFVYLISNESLESPYCQAELREALRLNKQILPVIVRRLKPPYPGNAPDDLEHVLKKTQYVDLTDMRDTTGIANLYAAINRLLEQSTSSAPKNDEPTPQPPVPDKKKTPWREKLTEGQGIIIAAVIGLISVIAAAAISLSPSPFDNPDNSEPSTTTNDPTSQPTPIGGGQGQIAFWAKEDELEEIYVVDTTTDEVRKLLGDDGFRYLWPSFSPDGESLAFVSNRGGNENVWIADATGTNPRSITDNSTEEWGGVAWSPDGIRIAFTRRLSDGDQIYVMNENGSSQIMLTCGTESSFFPVWSPDGSQIIFQYGSGENNRQLVLINVSDAEESCANETTWTILTPSQQQDCDNRNASWSPELDQIVYSSDCNNDGIFEVYAMSLENPDEYYQITDYPSGSPAYSPDKSLIAIHRSGSIRLLEAESPHNPTRSLNTELGGSDLSWRP